jgi:actin
MSIHQMVNQSILHCDIDIRQDIFANIIFSGGNTMFEGMAERLTKEMKLLVPQIPIRTEASSSSSSSSTTTTTTTTTIATKPMPVKVISPPERKYSAWIGGSILASLSTFSMRWISKQVDCCRYDAERQPVTPHH